MPKTDLEGDENTNRENDEECMSEGRELGADEAYTWVSEDCPPEVLDDFERHMKAYDEAPETTHFRELEALGIELPDPELMDDQQLTAKLWGVIQALADMRVFVGSTDHLSDRELYTDLWAELLRVPVVVMPNLESYAHNIDIVGSGSEEDIELYLKYYANEESRQHWAKSFPDEPIPDHEDPPFNRDRDLPKADFKVWAEHEDDVVM